MSTNKMTPGHCPLPFGWISAAYAIDELPRSAIGKVLKRELRDRL